MGRQDCIRTNLRKREKGGSFVELCLINCPHLADLAFPLIRTVNRRQSISVDTSKTFRKTPWQVSESGSLIKRLRKDGNEAFRNGDLQKAVELLTKTLKAHPRDEKSLANRSAVMLEMGNPIFLNSAISLSPGQGAAKRNNCYRW